MMKSKIMLINNDPLDARALKQILIKEHYEVIYKFNKGEEIKTFLSEKPDLVIIDDNYNIKNGIDHGACLDIIRFYDERIPIIVLGKDNINNVRDIYNVIYFNNFDNMVYFIETIKLILKK